MKLLLLASLLAITSFAQTVPDLSMLMPCEGRPAAQCNGQSVDGFCRMNYNKVPARCEDGDPMDREDICASLQETDCKSKQGCCWGMRENFMIGKCVPFEMDVEDCPAMVLPRIFPAMGGGATDATGGDAVTDTTGGDTVTGDAATGDAVTGDAVTGDAVTGDAVTGDAVTGDQTPSTDATADQTPSTNTMSYPFMTPNPPVADRTFAQFGCETQGMTGPDACNNLKTFGGVCGWNVKEGGCEEIELGKGNLCKTVADQETCNLQGDCCWDMKGYCGEYDFGDCLRPMPSMNMGGIVMPQMPSVNIGGMSFTPGIEEQIEMHSEAAEAHAEMMGDRHEAMMEGVTGELEFEDVYSVTSCDGLAICHGRVGMTGVCVPDANGKCTQMNLPAMPMLPSLRKEHQSQSSTSAPFNYGHLAMVLGGGLIVGLAAGMCFQNLRSKSSIAPVLLEDNYRNI